MGGDRNVEGLPNEVHSSNVVLMFVGEPDLPEVAALRQKLAQVLGEFFLLFGDGRCRIDDHELIGT